jgi:hypothetical protein
MRQRAKVNNWRGAVHNCIGINSGRRPGNTCGIGVALDDYPARMLRLARITAHDESGTKRVLM